MPVPFLWLCGPSGVGKSAVGWEIFAQLSRSGIRTGYVDADQLGMCYEPSDSDNHSLKARNLGALWSVFRDAGSRCLIFSGWVDEPEDVVLYANQVPDTQLTLCRLRVGRDELRRRFLGRGWLLDRVADAVAQADALDRNDFAELRVDTDGRSVAEVARLVRIRAGL